jgi:hypothetical protein
MKEPPWYPLDRRLGELQSRSGRDDKVKNFQPLPGLQPAFIQPVAQRYTTEQSRLLREFYFVNHKSVKNLRHCCNLNILHEKENNAIFEFVTLAQGASEIRERER